MIYVEGPAAAVAIMPNLICYFSIPTVACIWYIDFLPPHCLGSLPVFFFWFVCLELEEGVQSSEHSSPGCDIRVEVYGFGITTAQHPKLNSPLGPNPLRLEVGIGEHAADWAACSFAFSFIVSQVFGSDCVAAFLHAADHGDDAASNVELLA